MRDALARALADSGALSLSAECVLARMHLPRRAGHAVSGAGRRKLSVPESMERRASAIAPHHDGAARYAVGEYRDHDDEGAS